MAKYYSFTVGCQMNVADSNYICRALEKLGHIAVDTAEEADLVVLNSCSVRLSAEERVTGRLGELYRVKRNHPEMKIALTGCMVPGQEEALAKRFPIIDYFFKPSAWEDFIAMLPADFRQAVPNSPTLPPTAREGEALPASPRRFSSMISLQPADAPLVATEQAIPTFGELLANRDPLDPDLLLTDPRRSPLSHAEQAIVVTSGREGSPFPRPLGTLAAAEQQNVTAYIPVIYGCNKQCSYCVIPFRRGRERSRTVVDIVNEVRDLVAADVREVTLLGQNVDTYGHDLSPRSDLADLLEALEQVEGLWRVRFLTSHPKDMSQKLLDTVGRLSKACEHINLPVQAGDDRTLRAMRRSYRMDYYIDLIGRIRAAIPGVSLATDIIVGFPGESEEQFANTFAMLEEIKFDAVHVAAYSPRPGTYAYTLGDDVPLAEKRRRLQKIEHLQEQVLTELNAPLLGQVAEVLVEGMHNGRWTGRTRPNKVAHFDGATGVDYRGRLVNLRLTKVSAWSVQGELV